MGDKAKKAKKVKGTNEKSAGVEQLGVDPALERFRLAWACCKQCGVGPTGFSITFDPLTDTYQPVWDQFCSMGCSIASEGSPTFLCL